ncbi:hypothetical protein ACFTY8_35100 [Streptomyces mirabilis]|uniref:hypothetical protein n=1 Tax=Streptomyces mirabilis TaxID=68239 RepID=UPI003641494B
MISGNAGSSGLVLRRSPTAAEAVEEEQVHRLLDRGGRADFRVCDRLHRLQPLSENILPVVLKAVNAEQQEGYVQRLEPFADNNRERLAQLYGKYGPGAPFADESRCYLTHQPASVVVCERLDTVPMRLEGVWNDEIDAELVLLDFRRFR